MMFPVQKMDISPSCWARFFSQIMFLCVRIPVHINFRLTLGAFVVIVGQLCICNAYFAQVFDFCRLVNTGVPAAVKYNSRRQSYFMA